ncbi:MAG: hypothetical protein HOV81_34820 [Kofleriaceae bacterium]|nr:hypothetical protein [Kofleriaceae bacterium]
MNLIDLVRNRELPKDAGDDLLFGGNARFDATAMPVQAAPVTLPAPAPMVAGAAKVRPAYDHFRPSQMRLADAQARAAAGPSPLVKKVVAGGCAFVAVMVVLAVYLAKRDSSPSAALAASAPKAEPAVVVAPVPPAAPVVTPIETKVETTVTPIETAAAAEPANRFSPDPALQPTVVAGPVVTPEESQVVAAAEVSPIAKVAKKSSRKSSSRAAKRAKAQKRETRVAIAEPVKTKNVKLGGKGQLAIANASGGDIWVDGRKPRSSRVTLEPGKHNITMFDKKTKKAKTFQVEIKPNQTTTVRR